VDSNEIGKLMSVTQADIAYYGSANMPDADGATTGGAVDFSKRILFSDIAPAGALSYYSSAAGDTAVTVAITGRDSTGVIQTETKTVSGTAGVAGSQTFERLLKGVVSGTAATGDIGALSTTAVASGTAQGAAAATASAPASMTLQAGQGASVALGQIVRATNNSPAGVQYQMRQIIAISGDTVYLNRDWGTVPTNATTYTVNEGMLFEILPNRITQVRRPFYNASADVAGGANRNYYEKVFAVNNNASTALTTASIIKQVDPSGATALNIALCSALNDTGSVANRQTAPSSGITAFTSGAAPQSIGVPGANLPPGAAPNAAGAQGVWLNLTLNAGVAAAKTSLTLRTTGTTT
jgi:hypothetical protein